MELKGYKNRNIRLKVVFALLLLTQSTIFSQINHWETVVYENDNWKYIVPATTVSTNWNTVGYNDASWATAQGGFGYGDGDDNTILPNGTVSCFQRITFTITDTSIIELVALTIDYDDGFVAYLNGVEITRALLTGTGQPTWNQTASGFHEASAYQGIYPFQYTLSKSFLSANLNQGVNVLAIQTHNESAASSDMSSRVYLSIGVNIATQSYGVPPAWFAPPILFDSSNLPIVVINTGGSAILNDPKIDATMGIIYNGIGQTNFISDAYNEFYGQIGIEIRGSSSASFPKKAYGLETRGPDSSNYNVSIFDWPVDNDWILYAPYSDKSLIRNVLTYDIGNKMGNYAPRTKMCEVVINGEYQGVYAFMERIKQNPGRVNIDELTYNETTGNEITGGYIVKIDKTTARGIVAWTSPFTSALPGFGPITYQLHDPKIDTINPLQLSYIQTYITNFETALDGPNFTDPILGYAPYIDVPSFIDFMLVNEISKNVDGYRISTFLHKKKASNGGKLIAGPLWDFNLGWGNANYCDGGLTSGWEIDFNAICGGGGGLQNPFHWTKLVQDPNFANRTNCRWQELRQTTLNTDTIIAYIDNLATYLNDAANRNYTKWQVLGIYLWPNNFVGNTYSEEINYLKNWTIDRLNWMDANMFGVACPNVGIIENNTNVNITIYPNPFNSYTNIHFENPLQNSRVELRNNIGEIIKKQTISSQLMQLDLSTLAKGLYYIYVFENNQLISVKKLISQ